MSNTGTYNSCVSSQNLMGGGYNYLLINNLHNYCGGFGFKTAALLCPDGMTRSGPGGVFFLRAININLILLTQKSKNEQENETNCASGIVGRL